MVPYMVPHEYMSDFQKLYEKAKASAANLRFDEACKLARLAGFIGSESKKKGKGSHVWFRHPKANDPTFRGLNFQKMKDGKAKPYQVRQLLNAIDDYGLATEE